MVSNPNQSAPSPPRSPGKVCLNLCTADSALAAAWSRVSAPAGFELRTAPQVRPEDLAADETALFLVDAEAVLTDEGPLAVALQYHAARCVWVGRAEALDRLGLLRLQAAYDVIVTPTTPAVLALRLGNWARNILRTAALGELGGRVETLAEQNDRLAAHLAEVETQAQVLTRQRERLDQALRRIRQVACLSREINSLDLDKIIAVCVQRLPSLVEACRASFYLYDAATDALILQDHSPGYPITDRVSLQDSPRSPMAVAVRREELMLIGEFNEFQRQADVIIEREFREQYATHSCIIVPVKGGGRVRGVLNLADKQGGGRFDEEIDLPVVEQIAELVGASIYNVELYQEMEHRAKTDPLTGLANRRALEEALTRESDRSRRYGSHLAVLMIDVDQLKVINDRVGHHAGDAILQNVAAVLAETVRSVDVPGRWAGDEFLVVLPDTSAPQAERLAQRLLERFREKPAIVAGQPIASSLSVGVAQFERQESQESLIHRVDQAMYAAKQAGRDRVAVAEPPPPPTDKGRPA